MARRSTSTSTRRSSAAPAPRISAADRRASDAAERAERERVRHAPVSLPSGGSFDQGELAKALDGATDTAVGNRDAEVRAALKGAEQGQSTLTSAPNSLPDHVIARTEVQIERGTEDADGNVTGGKVVTEFRQVFDAKGAEDRAPKADRDAVVADAGTNDGRSEILSLEVVEAAPLAAPVDTAAPADDRTATSNPDAVGAEIAGALHDVETSTATDTSAL